MSDLVSEHVYLMQQYDEPIDGKVAYGVVESRLAVVVYVSAAELKVHGLFVACEIHVALDTRLPWLGWTH